MNILRKSDESACTIVPSKLSIFTPSLRSRTSDSVVSEVPESSLVYRELAIDDDLFTARVYKRNYYFHKVQGVNRKLRAGISPNKALINSSTPRMDPSQDPSTITSAVEPTTTGISQLSITSSQPIQDEPRLAAGFENIVTGWLVLIDSDDGQYKYVGIPGPKVSKSFFDQQGLSEWKTSHTKFPTLDSNFVCSVIEELFESLMDKPIDWLHHCLMAACETDRGNLIRMILKEDFALFSSAIGFYYNRSRHPAELAFHHGHIHIAKDLLRFSDTALYNRYAVGERMIRHAIREHDAELLSLILMQNSYSSDNLYVIKRPIIRLEHRDCSETCLASIIEASAKIKPSSHIDRSGLRFLAPVFPPDIVIVTRLPLSVLERRRIIETILMKGAFVRCSHHGFVWQRTCKKVVQGIADYLMVQNGWICLGEVSVETYSRLNDFHSLRFREIARRLKMVAALKAIR